MSKLHNNTSTGRWPGAYKENEGSAAAREDNQKKRTAARAADRRAKSNQVEDKIKEMQAAVDKGHYEAVRHKTQIDRKLCAIVLDIESMKQDIDGKADKSDVEELKEELKEKQKQQDELQK